MPLGPFDPIPPREKIRRSHINDLRTALTGIQDAYDVAVANGFTGTRGQWLDSLKGEKGDPGAGLAPIGSAETVDDLPDSGNTVGDVRTVDADGRAYRWDGDGWVDVGLFRGPPGDLTQAVAETLFLGKPSGTPSTGQALVAGTWQDKPLIDSADYSGIVGDSSNDDTDGLEAAIQDAIANRAQLKLRKPASRYVITRTINIEPQGDDPQATLELLGDVSFAEVMFAPLSDRVCFRLKGVKRSAFRNINVRLDDSGDTSDVILWDIHCDTDHESTSNVLFERCSSYLYGSGYANTGWRFSSLGSISDASFYTFLNCVAAGSTSTYRGHGNIGWHDINSNSLNHVWINSFWAGMEYGFAGHWRFSRLSAAITASDTDIPVLNGDMFFRRGGTAVLGSERITYASVDGDTLTGCVRGVDSTTAASHAINTQVHNQEIDTKTTTRSGGSSKFFIGTGGGYTNTDYSASTAGGLFTVHGGRYEWGKRFLNMGAGGSAVSQWAISGVSVDRYQPDDDILFALGAGGLFRLQDSQIGTPADDATEAMISATSSAGQRIVNLDNVAVVSSGDGPFWTLQDDDLLEVTHLVVQNASLQASSVISSPIARSTNTSETIAAHDAIVLVDATASPRTITLPTAAGKSGKQYTIKRTNSGENAVTVDSTATETIDGATTKTLGSQHAFIAVVSDGTNWQIVASGGTVS